MRPLPGSLLGRLLQMTKEGTVKTRAVTDYATPIALSEVSTKPYNARPTMRYIIVFVVLFLTGPISISETYGGHLVGEGQLCAGLAGDLCEEGFYCDIPWGGGPFPPGSLCGASDAPGTCVKIIQDCPLTPEEVCGCDGKTYMNDCVRNQSTCTKGQQRKMLDPTSIATVSAPCALFRVLV